MGRSRVRGRDVRVRVIAGGTFLPLRRREGGRRRSDINLGPKREIEKRVSLRCSEYECGRLHYNVETSGEQEKTGLQTAYATQGLVLGKSRGRFGGNFGGIFEFGVL